MVDNLSLQTTQIFLPMWDGKQLVFAGSGNFSAIEDATPATPRNDNCANVITLAYLTQLWMKQFAPAVGTLINQEILHAGSNTFTKEVPIGSLTIELDTTNWEGNQTYDFLKYGNYGALSFAQDDHFRFPVQWLNFELNAIVPPYPLLKAVTIFLKQGLTGKANFYTQDSVPDMSWAYQGTNHIANPWRNKIF